MFVSRDGRRGRIECDDRLCDATSPEVIYHRGGGLPDGWVISMRHQRAPGVEGHLCPLHASRQAPPRPRMRWLNEPPEWAEEDGALRILTAPDTDFWRTTHYGFVRDTGHFRYQEVAGDFVARVRIEGEFRDQYDQAGLMVREDAETWLKCGIELVDGRQCASVVITRGLSDWSVVPLDPAPPRLWFEVRRVAEAVQVSFGVDEPDRPQRMGALSAAHALQVGVMAASPDGLGFRAVLRDFAVTTPPGSPAS